MNVEVRSWEFGLVKLHGELRYDERLDISIHELVMICFFFLNNYFTFDFWSSRSYYRNCIPPLKGNMLPHLNPDKLIFIHISKSFYNNLASSLEMDSTPSPDLD